jgi:hypothetical protein
MTIFSCFGSTKEVALQAYHKIKGVLNPSKSRFGTVGGNPQHGSRADYITLEDVPNTAVELPHINTEPRASEELPKMQSTNAVATRKLRTPKKSPMANQFKTHTVHLDETIHFTTRKDGNISGLAQDGDVISTLF